MSPVERCHIPVTTANQSRLLTMLTLPGSLHRPATISIANVKGKAEPPPNDHIIQPIGQVHSLMDVDVNMGF